MCRRRIALFVLVCGASSCTTQPRSGPHGELALEVAPLALEGIDRACYDVRVEAGGDLVWTRGEVGLAWPGDDDALCSDRFGNGAAGDIASTLFTSQRMSQRTAVNQQNLNAIIGGAQ